MGDKQRTTEGAPGGQWRARRAGEQDGRRARTYDTSEGIVTFWREQHQLFWCSITVHKAGV